MLHHAVDMKHSEFQQNNEREIQRFGETGKRKYSTSLSKIGILGKDPKMEGRREALTYLCRWSPPLPPPWHHRTEASESMETRVATPAAKSIKSTTCRIDSNQKPTSKFGPKLKPRSCSEPPLHQENHHLQLKIHDQSP
jgi:hypothetical protein